ncbi:hypothetical protein HY449_02900 [Candidatus Pacearchaeota archaeon]|nr:hypothetical protein [Candidatus Pacearchaeota archaeon]
MWIKELLKKQFSPLFISYYLLIVLTIILLYSIKYFSKKFFYDLDVNVIWFVLTFVFILGILILVKIYAEKIDNNYLLYYFFKKINYWTIFSFSLIFILLLVSFNIYNNYAIYPLPFEGTLSTVEDNVSKEIIKENLIEKPYVKCSNIWGERDYIIDKEVTCYFILRYKEGFTSYLSEIEKYYFYFNGSAKQEKHSMDINQIEDNIQHWNVAIPINKDFGESTINLYFKENNESQKLTNSLRIAPSRLFTEETYYEKREKSFLLFLTTISILIFSTITTIKNFRDLSEPSNNNSYK